MHSGLSPLGQHLRVTWPQPLQVAVEEASCSLLLLPAFGEKVRARLGSGGPTGMLTLQLGPRPWVVACRGADIGSWSAHRAVGVTTALASGSYLIFRVYL